MSTVSCFPVSGNSFEGIPARAEETPISQHAPSAWLDDQRLDEPNPFQQLVRLYHENEVLLKQLRENRTRMESVRQYLASPESHAAMGQARVLQLRARHSAALTLLRANRAQARRLLARRPD